MISNIRPWLTIVGAMLGTMLCVATSMGYSMGVFVAAFGEEYGWSRGEVSLSMTFFTAVTFLGAMPIGRLADRFHAGRVATISMLAFGLTLLAIPQFVNSLTTLWAAYFIASIAGLGTSPSVLIKPVMAAFTTRRGLAGGLALSGAGLGAFFIPPMVSAAVERGGWAAGYETLGWLAMGCAPILWLTLGSSRARANALRSSAERAVVGISFQEAIWTRSFWMLSFIGLFVGIGTAGAVTHLIPFLREQNFGTQEAATIASVIGIASVAGRLLTGATLDRINHPAIGAVFLVTGAVGAFLLAVGYMPGALLAAGLLGFAIGAEIDLLAYFVSRYFGLRAHSAIFGWTYGMVALGGGTGPALAGWLRDQQGVYVQSFVMLSILIGVGALLCLLLGRYVYAANDAAEPVEGKQIVAVPISQLAEKSIERGGRT